MISTVNAIAIAIVAVLAEQIGHEITHGIAAIIVGKDWQILNLFAVYSVWPGDADAFGDGVVAASAALLNIFTGFVAIFFFGTATFANRPTWRLFWLYFAGFSLLAGFGYLMVDPLFYRPGGGNLGDWQKIVDLLGGTWAVRAPISAVGAAGVLLVFFWLPRAVMKLGDGSIERTSRVSLARTLLLVPYLVVCTVLTVMALWHPLGMNGLVLMAMKYWMGFSAFFWGFFIAGYWAKLEQPISNPTPLPAGPARGWIAGAAVGLVVASALLLPGIEL